MEKNTIYAILLLVVVAVIGAVYWLLEGYVASSDLMKSLLGSYKWLGTVLTVALVCVVAYALRKVHKEK
ncbi:MAG: hypothetical protein KAT49_00825 [Methanomicrobia archaeon]|nr:hypothetical protein [Methanomicrobia archaeon]